MVVRANHTHDVLPACVFDAYILAPARVLGISTVLQKPCDDLNVMQQWHVNDPNAELVRLGAEHPLPDDFMPVEESSEPVEESLERKTREAANGSLDAPRLRLRPPVSLRELSLSDVALRRRRKADARRMASPHLEHHYAGKLVTELDFRPNDFGRAAAHRRAQTAATHFRLRRAVDAMKEQAPTFQAGRAATPKRHEATKATTSKKKPAQTPNEALRETLERSGAARTKVDATAAKTSTGRARGSPGGTPGGGRKAKEAKAKAEAGETVRQHARASARPAKPAWQPPNLELSGLKDLRRIGAHGTASALQPQHEIPTLHMPRQPAHANSVGARVPPTKHGRRKSARHYKQRPLEPTTGAGLFLEMDGDQRIDDMGAELQALADDMDAQLKAERSVQTPRLGPLPAHLQGLEKRRTDMKEVDTRLASGKIIYYVKNKYCYRLRIGFRIQRKYDPEICGHPTFADDEDGTIESMGSTSDFAEDKVTENAAGVGTFGGSCTCPSGAVYQVGAIGTDCSTLACAGGTAGVCSKAAGVWSGRSVTCGGAGAALVRTTINGCACKKTWTYEGLLAPGQASTIRDFCGDPDARGSDWCYVQDGCTAESEGGRLDGRRHAVWGECACARKCRFRCGIALHRGLRRSGHLQAPGGSQNSPGWPPVGTEVERLLRHLAPCQGHPPAYTLQRAVTLQYAGFCARSPTDVMSDELHMRAEERRLATLTRLDLRACPGARSGQCAASYTRWLRVCRHSRAGPARQRAGHWCDIYAVQAITRTRTSTSTRRAPTRRCRTACASQEMIASACTRGRGGSPARCNIGRRY